MVGHLRRNARTPSRMSASLAMMRTTAAGDFLLVTSALPSFQGRRAGAGLERRAVVFCVMRVGITTLAFAQRLGLRLLTGAAVMLPFAAAAQGPEETATYRNPRFGFSLTYPTARFKPKEPLAEDGRVWVSHDGNARLLAGALANADNMRLEEYREYLLKKSYPGAAIDYAPMRENWFVLSGTRDGLIFYERVTFTCGGRLINSWAILYPEAERAVYDPIVEKVARSYRAGTGGCG
jgi:hypothetical protein